MDNAFDAENLGDESSKTPKKKIGEEFLHVIDVGKVSNETGLSVAEMSDLLHVDVQSINRWSCSKAKSGNRPKYNSIIKLLRHGATVETLFGVDYAKIHDYVVENSGTNLLDSPEFRRRLMTLIHEMNEEKPVV